jgi:hypothetical protein
MLKKGQKSSKKAKSTQIIYKNMEVPENLYIWLKSTGLFQLPSSGTEIPADILPSFESGYAFTKLIKRLNQVKVTAI